VAVKGGAIGLPRRGAEMP